MTLESRVDTLKVGSGESGRVEVKGSETFGVGASGRGRDVEGGEGDVVGAEAGNETGETHDERRRVGVGGVLGLKLLRDLRRNTSVGRRGRE
jgi:hypothetical protein